jgi:hypothetical protein
VNGRGTVPVRSRSSAPPAVVCPSPLPPKISEADAVELRRQMSTAPPPESDGKGKDRKPKSNGRRSVRPQVPAIPTTPTVQIKSAGGGPARSKRPSLREDDVGTIGITISAKQIPRLVKGRKDLSSAPIDPKAAFLLSQVDGMLTVDDLSDLTALPRDEVLTILQRMVRLGLVLL